MLSTENDLRDALAPLRAVEPTDDDVARALDAVPAPTGAPATRSPVRRAWRPALAVAGVTAVVAIGIAALPAGSGDDGGGGAQALLRSAAATAAEQRPAPVTAYRYTRDRKTLTYRESAPGGRVAAYAFTQPTDQWIGADGDGRERTEAATDVRRTGDRRLLRLMPTGLASAAGERRRESGDAPFRAADVPDDATAARRYLDDRLRSAYGRVLPDAQARYERTRDVLTLLGEGAVRPAQRAALFGVLADTEGVIDNGTQPDAVGRRGKAVLLDVAGGSVPSVGGRRTLLPEGTIRVVFDAENAQLLSWSFTHDGVGSNLGVPDQEHVYLRQGWVDRIGELPPADPSKG